MALLEEGGVVLTLLLFVHSFLVQQVRTAVKKTEKMVKSTTVK